MHKLLTRRLSGVLQQAFVTHRSTVLLFKCSTVTLFVTAMWTTSLSCPRGWAGCSQASKAPVCREPLRMSGCGRDHAVEGRGWHPQAGGWSTMRLRSTYRVESMQCRVSHRDNLAVAQDHGRTVAGGGQQPNLIDRCMRHASSSSPHNPLFNACMLLIPLTCCPTNPRASLRACGLSSPTSFAHGQA